MFHKGELRTYLIKSFLLKNVFHVNDTALGGRVVFVSVNKCFPCMNDSCLYLLCRGIIGADLDTSNAWIGFISVELFRILSMAGVETKAFWGA